MSVRVLEPTNSAIVAKSHLTTFVSRVRQSSDLDIKGLDEESTCLLPAHTVDTHVHVFDPRLGPYSPIRAYTPERASLIDLISFNQQISSEAHQAPSFVIVQPSPYGTDNTVLLSILRQFRRRGISAKGIAVVDVDTICDGDLKQMHELGVRGLRLNLQAHGHDVDLVALQNLLVRAASRIQHLPGWKLQLFAPAHIWEDLYDTIINLPVQLIADHTGGLLAPSKLISSPWKYHANSPTTQPGFASLVSLAKSSRVLIKISGLYRSSNATSTNFEDMQTVISELAIQAPDALIWGSDWPHTGEGKDRLKNRNLTVTEPFRQIDNEEILRNLRDWVRSEKAWEKMMVTNPRAVFGL